MVDGTTARRVLREIFYEHWSIKVAAFVLAAIVFVVTRDEVTRTFEVPLRIRPDPERVLMTDVPTTVQVQVRGPWTRINRLQDYDFGTATLDLRDAAEGPLTIDEAAFVMPSGIVLAGVQYDSVDLRFDPVIEQDVPIEVATVGAPAEDYEVVAVTTTPRHWGVRGGRSAVRRVAALTAEPVDVDGATDDVAVRRAIEVPADDVRLTAGPEGATVLARAVIEPKQDTRPYDVPVAVQEGIDPSGAIPTTYAVMVTGPLPEFRALDRLGITFPVTAVAELTQPAPDGGGVAEVRFAWADAVPQRVRDRLSFDHAIERVPVPPPPPPPLVVEPLEAPP